MNLTHLLHLLGPHGVYEHALYREPRVEHGYCVDDNARAVVVTAHQQGPEADAIFYRCLDFVIDGYLPEGWRNRRSADGEWTDGPGPEDSHGRAIWALGVAAEAGRLPEGALPLLLEAAERPLQAMRSNLYALLGLSAAVRAGVPDLPPETLLAAVERLPDSGDAVWPWPEPRLTYDNARLPHALIESGLAIESDDFVDRGLRLLEWLVEVETRDSWFSFTPVGGRGPGDRSPAFDQQPIEVWAMAEACEAAALATAEGKWREQARRAVAWFSGLNDVGVALYDPATGAGHDGLEPTGVNRNCGAESTISALGAVAVGERLDPARPPVPG